MSILELAVIVGMFLFAFVGISAIAMATLGPMGHLEARVRQLRDEQEEGSDVGWRVSLRRFQAFLTRLGEMIPRSPKEMTRQQRKLLQAGVRHKGAPTVFLGLQVALAVGFLLVFSVTGLLQTNAFLYVILSVFLGAAVPDMWLSEKVRRRKMRIRLALPDALDLLVVCIEAGLGLDQSLMRIGQEMRRASPDLSDELRLLNLELNAGTSRPAALRNLGDRSDVEDLKSLVAVLIQTDKFGTSIADSLRVFSDTFRVKRRQRAEEAAAKMSVKMIPPLFLFILPATFAVVVGPAIIQIAKGLLPWMSGQGE